MNKANYYSSMIHKPGLKIVNLPKYLANYNTILNMLNVYKGIETSRFQKYTGLVSSEN